MWKSDRTKQKGFKHLGRGGKLWDSDQDTHGETHGRSGLFQLVPINLSINSQPLLFLAQGAHLPPGKFCVLLSGRKTEGREPCWHLLFLKCLQLKIINRPKWATFSELLHCPLPTLTGIKGQSCSENRQDFHFMPGLPTNLFSLFFSLLLSCIPTIRLVK